MAIVNRKITGIIISLTLCCCLYEPVSAQDTLTARQLKNINRFVDGFNEQNYKKVDKSLCFLARLISSKKMLKNYLSPRYKEKGKLVQNGPVALIKPRSAVYPFIQENDSMQLGFYMGFYFSKRGKIMSFTISYDDIVTPKVADTTTIEDLVSPYMAFKHHDHTAMVIGCYDNGKKTIYSYGKLDDKGHSKPDGNTIYEIGSITKVFTGIMLAKAINEGKMDTSDVLSKFLPDSIPPLKYKDREINMLDLVTHTSALPREPNNYKQTAKHELDPFGNYKENDLLTYLKHEKLKYEPGTKCRYSNTGVGLLGYILSGHRKERYDSMLVTDITSKLGMNDTKVELSAEQMTRKTNGYFQGMQVNDMEFTEVFVGAGAIHSTANDMLKFIEANLNPENTSMKKDLELAQKPRNFGKHVTMGLAWDYDKVWFGDGDKKIMGHGGNTVGASCILLMDKEKKLGIIVLANSNVPVDGIGYRLYELMIKNKGAVQ